MWTSEKKLTPQQPVTIPLIPLGMAACIRVERSPNNHQRFVDAEAHLVLSTGHLLIYHNRKRKCVGETKDGLTIHEHNYDTTCLRHDQWLGVTVESETVGDEVGNKGGLF